MYAAVSLATRSPGRNQRAVSIGVRVKETYIEKRVAVATVNPNCLKYIPITPPISATGTNTTTSTRVFVASARPISCR